MTTQTMKTHRDGSRAYFDMTFAPSLDLVSAVRVFITSFFQDVVRDEDLAGRVGLAIHELLENAIRYSLDGETSIRIEMIREPATRIEIRTRNRATAADLAKVRSQMAELHGAADAMEHYQMLMRRSVGTPSTVSGLGIGRIALEAEMDMALDVEGDVVVVTARTQETHA